MTMQMNPTQAKPENNEHHTHLFWRLAQRSLASAAPQPPDQLPQLLEPLQFLAQVIQLTPTVTLPRALAQRKTLFALKQVCKEGIDKMGYSTVQ